MDPSLARDRPSKHTFHSAVCSTIKHKFKQLLLMVLGIPMNDLLQLVYLVFNIKGYGQKGGMNTEKTAQMMT